MNSIENRVTDSNISSELRPVGPLPSLSAETPEGTPSTNSPSRFFESVEPSPAPVEGHVLLDSLVRELSRFVVFPKWAAEAFALWIVHTYCFHLRTICTYIAVESPDKECGKSTLLNVLAAFVNRPVVSSNITSSAFFRLIEEFMPTLLIDEADTNLRGSDELRGILNAGYFKPNAFVWRMAYDLSTDGTQSLAKLAPLANGLSPDFSNQKSKIENQKCSYLARFTCWCPKVIASIGRVHETLASRCIVVRLQRKSRDEVCERLKFLDATGLKRQCARFATDHADAIAMAQPAIPSGLANRAADVWEPLLAIADLAGSRWPQLARDAALGLTSAAQNCSPIAALLLDILLVLARNKDRAYSRDIVLALNAKRDRPWAELRNGKPIDELWLARQLKPYGVRPITIRIDGTKGKGYTLERLSDTLRRYVPLSEAEAFRKELLEEAAPDPSPENATPGTSPAPQ